MPAESTIVNTFTCSMQECKARRVLSGTFEEAAQICESEGWNFGLGLFDFSFDLCPDHSTELKEWLGVTAELVKNESSIQR